MRFLKWKAIIGLGLLLFFAGLNAQTPVLSHLSAGADDPIYTTYAATMQRSEFALDEGYHLVYYDSTRGIEFATDTGGNLGLAFQVGGNYIYKLQDIFQKPIITTSYPDLVKLYYYPVQDLRVDLSFLVYSSHYTLENVSITNEGQQNLEFTLYSLLQNHYRDFNAVEKHSKDNAITFRHQELPDGWTLGHHLPYASKINDVLMLSDKPDHINSFRMYQPGTVKIPHQVELDKKPRFLVYGSIKQSDGSRCGHRPPDAHLIAYLNKNPDQIITETAPRWGDSQQNINGYGSYGLELGNFENISPSDSFTVHFVCSETSEATSYSGTFQDFNGKHRLEHNMQLKPAHLPGAPVILENKVQRNYGKMKISWKNSPAPASYKIYRRNYRKNGFYRQIATVTSGNSYTDKSLTDDPIYGYIVTAVVNKGRMSGLSREVNSIGRSDLLTYIDSPKNTNAFASDFAKVLSLEKDIQLKSGENFTFSMVRGVSRSDKPVDSLLTKAKNILGENIEAYKEADEKLFSNAPQLTFEDSDTELLYWSAWNLMRQVMLPPEGESSYNYYVFSREPQWGWGHGGQVFHESLTMLAYAFFDPMSAMNSQRVYSERQRKSGYINYRTGPYLNESIPVNDQLTTSAPWYAWQNWMVYQVTGDTTFLREMYQSSKAFHDYYVSHRDSDNDGLCEWGAHAVLESVRDAKVAVWDQVGWPSNFEGMGLNSMLVMEEKSLAKMARKLGRTEDAEKYQQMADKRSKKINALMWDDKTGFYYNIDKKDNDFTYKEKNDLKRQEIIGFLPMWAGIVSKKQAAQLVQQLTDSTKFWRKYGVPSLAADDPYYQPKGYWNGPVWVEWDYLIEYGLLQYGYDDIANEMVSRVTKNMIAELKKNHQLWEFYSPDDQWAGYHRQYIWAGIINRMLIDLQKN